MRKLLFFCIATILSITVATSRAQAATNVTGTWTGSIPAPDGSGGTFDLTFTFKQDGSTVTGNVAAAQGGDPLTINNGKIDGDKITFTVEYNGTTISHEGTVNGDEMKLTSKSADGSFPTSSMTLKRAKAEPAK